MLTASERSLLLKLVEELTGGTQTAHSRHENLVTNVERRMQTLGLQRLNDYLQHVRNQPKEMTFLISALTIHTTSWFRENPHFVAFQELLLDALDKNEVFKVWCAACSTGEEVYSFALQLEEFRRVHPKFDYRILGTDIDAVSLAVAERAIYSKRNMDFHVLRYKAHILEGSGKTADYFTLSKEIRDRVTFRQHDLRQAVTQKDGPFNICICRNVLIYFSPSTVGQVITNLLMNVRPDGYLMLGHSESVNGADFGLTQLGHSVYTRKRADDERRLATRYRVLCLDDSATTRKFLERSFADMGFECVTFATGSEATAYLNFNDVDLITVDLRMPDVDGDKWVQRERAEGLKTPVVVISDVHAGEAKDVLDLLSMGVQHYVEKDALRADPKKFKEIFLELVRKGASRSSPVVKAGGSRPTFSPDLIMIGASTGGPQALVRLLERMPANTPPIMITQHISPKFVRPLAERLADVSGLKLAPARHGVPMEPGHIYMAFDDHHIAVAQENGRFVFQTSNAGPFNGHRPSVDFMFNSALGLNGQVMAILLTGMGRDGALGLRFLRKEGAFCVAQSEEDCVVYGMPKEAIEREAADYIGNCEQIRELILDSMNLKKKPKAA